MHSFESEVLMYRSSGSADVQNQQMFKSSESEVLMNNGKRVVCRCRQMPFHALAAHTLQLPQLAMIAFTVMHTIKQTMCEMNAYDSSLSIKFWMLFLRCADQDT